MHLRQQLHACAEASGRRTKGTYPPETPQTKRKAENAVLLTAAEYPHNRIDNRYYLETLCLDTYKQKSEAASGGFD